MSKSRRSFSDEVKADAVRRHLSDKVPVSELAAELNVQPSQIHLWIKQVLDQAEKAFQRPQGGKQKKREDRKIAQLEEKLAGTSCTGRSASQPRKSTSRWCSSAA